LTPISSPVEIKRCMFFVRMMYLSDSTHDVVGSNESRAAFCHAQRVKCHGKEPVRVQFPQQVRL
jgi:hypothetical protein